MGVSDVLIDIFGCPKPVIGMVHLPPLPSAPGSSDQTVENIVESALRDAEALKDGGVDGLQVENIGDRPFMKPGQIGLEASALVAVVARKVRRVVGLPVGVFVLANGAIESLSAALASSASWVRLNMYNLAYIADEGYVEAEAAYAERLRSSHKIGVRLFADVLVKHGSHLIVSDLSVEYHVRRVEEMGADVVVISGARTGGEVSKDRVVEVKHAATRPVLVGSGVNPSNAEKLLSIADGAIIGTYFKRHGILSNPVDVKRVKQVMDVVKRLRK
jgi:membrane complex biogenesis BtpA family protein